MTEFAPDLLQGEMIQAKFGLAAVAERQLETYSTAVLLATESPPKPPRYARLITLLPNPACVPVRLFVDLFWQGRCSVKWCRYS